MKKLLFILFIALTLTSCAKEHCKRIEIRQLNGLTNVMTIEFDGTVCGTELDEAEKRNNTYTEIPYGNGVYRIVTLVKVY